MSKKPDNVRTGILAEAEEAVNSRDETYGPPEDCFLRIARLWNAHLKNIGMVTEDGDPILSTGDVALMMIQVKVARLSFQIANQDSWTDIAGYAACGAEVSEDLESE